MRLCYEVLRKEHVETRIARLNEAKAYAEELHKRFTPEGQYEKFVEIFNGESEKFDVQDWLNELEATETE